jgi:hypothetical protein
MADTFLDFMNPNYIVGMLPEWTDGEDRLPYFAESKFPNKKRDIFKLEFLKGYKQGSRLAPLSKLDANYSYKGREGYNEISQELPFVRFAKQLTEENMRAIEAAQALALQESNGHYITDLIAEIYADAPDLVRDVHALREYMRFQVLQTNGITVSSIDYNSATTQYDASFDVPSDPTWASNHVLSAPTSWSVDTSDPLSDILGLLRTARRLNGTVINEIIPSPVLYDQLLLNKKVREQLSTFYGILPSAVTIEQIQTWIASKGGGSSIKITNPWDYNMVYKDYAGVTQEFIDPTRVIALSAGAVGSTILAPTPAEAARRRKPKLQVATTDDRIAVHTVLTDSEPFKYDTVVSATFAPTGEGMDNVFGLSVPIPT